MSHVNSMRRLATLAVASMATQGLGCVDDSPPREIEPILQTAAALSSSMAPDEAVLGEHTVTTSAGTFTYRKTLAIDGRSSVSILDSSGKQVPESVVNPVPVKAPRISEVLNQRVSAGPSASIRVRVEVAVDLSAVASLRSYGSVQVGSNSSVNTTPTLNGKTATSADISADLNARLQWVASNQAALRSQRATAIRALVARERLALAEAEIQLLADGHEPLRISLPATDVHNFGARNADLISALDVEEQGGDDTLATAMATTSVSPGVLQESLTNGAFTGTWLTESGCPPAGYRANYTRISGSDTNHSRNTTAILGTVSPGTWIYCSSNGTAILPTSTELGGSGGHARVHLVSRSNSSTWGSYDSNAGTYDDFVINNLVPVVSSASNLDGTNNPTNAVGSPGVAFNVITVGNYNDATMTIAASSSFVNPTNTHTEKPELSGPGTNITAGTDAAGNPITESGTSQATPHVAGILADLTENMNWFVLRPHLAKPLLLVGAIDAITGGRDAVGAGGSDALASQWNHNDWWWEGSNSDWSYFTAHDDNAADTVTLNVNVNVTSGNYNSIAISWLNQGSYTTAHLADAHPIGMDLDLAVVNPSGVTVGSSLSWDNGYEQVVFWASVSGTYQIRITRPINRDTSSSLRLGLVHKYM